MTITEIMNNKSLKRLEKKNFIVEAIINREVNFSIISEACESLPEKNIPHYAKSPLFKQISDLCAKENESGVKNQYIKALKKAEKFR